jgi:group I intron endonuclease
MKFIYLIYCITNNINNKKYVGQTRQTLQKRFRDHSENKKRQLGLDIAKFGKESFSIDLLEIVDKTNNFTRETYWIEKKDSINNGYNTLYSSGIDKVLGDKIIIMFKNRHSVREIEKETHSCRKKIKKYLKENNFNILPGKTTNEITEKYVLKLFKKYYKSDYHNNSGIKRISNELNMITPTIRKILKKHNIILLSRQERDELRLKKIKELYEQNKSYKEIAEILNLPYTTVQGTIKKKIK